MRISLRSSNLSSFVYFRVSFCFVSLNLSSIVCLGVCLICLNSRSKNVVCFWLQFTCTGCFPYRSKMVALPVGQFHFAFPCFLVCCRQLLKKGDWGQMVVMGVWVMRILIGCFCPFAIRFFLVFFFPILHHVSLTGEQIAYDLWHNGFQTLRYFRFHQSYIDIYFLKCI